ncbi:MAG: hypothetical protein FWC16_11415 [Defluviitaleaceae bacterium]|nr:hypothetical protein [Defluviitaleaceae bacterium]MCL2275527.1 hypothetical protein [Defluviitaleaceae bacterium]
MKASATGANYDLPGFSPSNLDIHFGGGGSSDHCNQYPNISKVQYARLAHELVRKPVGGNIVGYVATKGRNIGSVVRYDKITNDWVRGSHIEIFTMFKPDDKMEYYEKIKSYETGS